MLETESHFSNLEFPAADAPLAPGWQQLRGWLVPKRGSHFVDVRARVGDRVFPGVYGFPRVDLATHFAPDRPWLPGEYTIDIELASGATELAIEALDFTGRWRLVQNLRCTTAGAPRARAPHDPLPPEEFGFAMRLGLKAKLATAGDPAREIAGWVPHPFALRPNHPPFHGFIDEPAAIAPAMYGRLPVLGWLFHETLAIRRAFVSTDLLGFQRLDIGGEFSGVKERFPQFRQAAHCRLFGFAEVSSQLPSPTSARFYAELEDGSTHLCLAVQSHPVPTEILKSAYLPFSMRRFWRGWRRSRQAFSNRGVPVAGGQKLLREFGKSILHYHAEAAPRVRFKEMTESALLPASLTTPPRRSRFLLVTHNLNFEGAPLLFAEYARQLVRACEAQLIVVSGQDGPLREAFARAGAEIKIVDVPLLLAAPSPHEFHRRITTLAAQFNDVKFDAVVANTLSAFWGVSLATSLACPSLFYIHESTNPVAFFKTGISAKLLPAVYDALEQATAVSFNTPATEAYYRPYASGRNFRLTPAWIDIAQIDSFRVGARREELRQRFGVGEEDLLVVNVGTVCDRKGQHDFVRAAAWLWRTQPDLARRCRFMMIGGRDTPYNRFLQETIDDLGRTNLAIVRETDRPYDYFAAADLFVCTSYEESFPRVVLEAMAFELPIATTNVHGIPYLLRAERDAWLLPPGDIPALAAAIQRALAFPEEAKCRARQARERVFEYDAARVLPQHVALTAAVTAAQL